ncbi:hypothetical protein K1T71_010897 [Dendrolimus kikuchii]|uniref:Uncharacterized protein n=1 Tax=Dendrolimus kikuchii TaxID=765133 RepID=A0ACC1CQ51_9NEOP|nr:hypothetical protein K1T71_010897 [Dendrolimus kikuchii]
MTMKLEISDCHSNQSDFSCDSQSSQGSSTNEYISSVPTSRSLLTLANLEGLQSGVPTRTTATITPTQLRNFEQTYIELNNCRSEPTTHAGFVPPSVTHANTYGILNSVGYIESGPTTALHVSPGPLSASGDSSSSPGLPTPKRRNMGGRRPTKAPQDLSPEEEERRKIRRERNKMAAARCRKRRLDHTNELQEETDKLEEKKQSLQDEIRKLNNDREHLQAILQTHLQSLSCRLNKRSTSPPDVKPFQGPYVYNDVPEDGVRVKVEVMDSGVDPVLALDNIFTSPQNDKRIMFSVTNPSVVTSAAPATLDTPPAISRPNRPNSLQVPISLTPAQLHNNKVLGNNKIAGIEISTPSNGIPFNFESLMEGGTGLTPVHPHPCAHQQRVAPDAASPDAHNSLVSL